MKNMDKNMNEKYGYGFKFLDENKNTTVFNYWNSAIEYNRTIIEYPIPKLGETWGEWFDHPTPLYFDGSACGPGGWHIMKTLNSQYAPIMWRVWRVQYRLKDILGQDREKIRVKSLRLSRISTKKFHELVRTSEIHDLRGANLRGAYLQKACFKKARLWKVNFSHADLRGANFYHADVSGADFYNADLRGADFRKANILNAHTLHKAKTEDTLFS